MERKHCSENVPSGTKIQELHELNNKNLPGLQKKLSEAVFYPKQTF